MVGGSGLEVLGTRTLFGGRFGSSQNIQERSTNDMATENTPDLDNPALEARALASLWTGIETQVEDLKTQIDKFLTRPEAMRKQQLIFFWQGFRAASATLLLLRNGMGDSAAATARLAFEHLFCAAACNEDPTYFSQLKRSDERGVELWTKNLGSSGALPDGIPQRFSTPVRSRDDDRSYKHIAIAAQLETLYEENYKFLSKAGAHANTVAIELATRTRGSLPEFNQTHAVMVNLKMCLKHFEQQWARFTASSA